MNTKRSFRVLIAAVFAILCQGQLCSGTEQGNIRFGAKAGLNVGAAGYSPLPSGVSNDPMTGFTGGVSARYGLNDSFYLQSEALYIRKGFTLISDSGGMRLEAGYKLDYLELPLLIGFVPGGGAGKLSIFAGPFASFLLGAKLETEVSGGVFGPFKFKNTTNVGRYFKSGDLGAVAGLGYSFSRAFSAELRVARGFSDISRIANAEIKSLDFSLMLGLLF